MYVIKRDGTKQIFDPSYIETAILAAASNVNVKMGDNAMKIALDIQAKLERKKQTDHPIATIQTLVENDLMASKYKDVARSYIEYRHRRDRIREAGSKLVLDIDGFLNYTNDDLTKENANKDAKSVNTHRDLVTGILSKHLAMTQILPPDVAQWHKDGYGHVHDLDYLISPLTNCQLVNYEDMLERGFTIGNAKIGQPNSIGVAATVLTQIIQAVASSQYGGQTSAHIDSGLKKYVEKSYNKLKKKQLKYNLPDSYVDEELNKEVYDAMQTFMYQVSSLTTTNGQAPFVTISFGLDTSKFGRMITENYLKVHTEGLGEDHVTPVFPKVIFFLDDGVNLKEGDPNYDLKKLAIVCASKRIYPDFISVPINKRITGAKHTAVSSMGCRSFLSAWEDENGVEKFNGRFNVGVVTVSLPMVAMQSKTENIDFFECLDSHFEMAYKAQMFRINRIAPTKARQNPVLFTQGSIARLDPDEEIGKLIYGGYASASIGFIGLAETVELLHGSQNKEHAIAICKFMKDKCNEFKMRSNVGFSPYGTPSESLALRSATCLKKMYGDVISRDYLTNSFHQPVWVDSSPIDKWLYEEGFADLISGGNIGYIEQPNLSNNLEAYEAFVDFAYQHIHYFGINTPIDKCFECDFEGEFTPTADGYHCPCCGNHDPNTISVIRRVSGYLASPQDRPMNKGKQQEVMQRVKHK